MPEKQEYVKPTVTKSDTWYYQFVYNGVDMHDSPFTFYDVLNHFHAAWIGRNLSANVERLHFEQRERQAVVIISSPTALRESELAVVSEIYALKPSYTRQLFQFIPEVTRV